MTLNVTLNAVYLGHVLSGRLDSHRGAVTAGVAVHAAHHSCNGRLLPITSWGMSDICTQEDDRLLEHRGPGTPTGKRKTVHHRPLHSECCKDSWYLSTKSNKPTKIYCWTTSSTQSTIYESKEYSRLWME